MRTYTFVTNKTPRYIIAEDRKEAFNMLCRILGYKGNVPNYVRKIFYGTIAYAPWFRNNIDVVQEGYRGCVGRIYTNDGLCACSVCDRRRKQLKTNKANKKGHTRAKVLLHMSVLTSMLEDFLSGVGDNLPNRIDVRCCRPERTKRNKK